MKISQALLLCTSLCAAAPCAAAEPRDTVAVVRWRNPDAAAAAVQSFLPVPGLVQGALGTALGPARAAIATSAPVDLLVALDPDTGDKLERPLWAFSVNLTSVAEAQRVIQGPLKGAVSPAGHGAFAVRIPMGNSAKDEFLCLMGPAGKAARIVCSDRQRDVDLLAPALLSGLPGLDLGPADLHAELRFGPAMKRYGASLQQALALGVAMGPQKLSLGTPRFDRALADLCRDLADEIHTTAAELDRATLDLQLGQAGVELRLGYRMKGRTSWLARSVAEEAAHMGPPPALFGRLPADSPSASFMRVKYSVRLSEALLAPLRALLDGWLEHEGLAEADRRAITALLEKQWPDTASAWASLPGGGGGGESNAVMRFLRQEGLLGGVAVPAAQPVALLDEFVATWRRPGVQAFLKKKLKGLDLQVPAITARSPKDLPAGSREVLAVITLPADAAKALETAAAPGKARAGKAGKAQKRAPLVVRAYLLMVPDQDRTWFAWGLDRPALSRRLQALIAPAQAGQTLADRPGLDELQKGQQVSGGFSTIAMLAERVWDTFAERAQMPASAARQALDLAPHHGETPILFHSTSSDGATLDREYLMRFPREAIEDLVSVILTLSNATKKKGI